MRRFVGRPVDGEIVLLSDEDDPQLRWRFTDITPRSFTWRGEISRDGGATLGARRGDAHHAPVVSRGGGRSPRAVPVGTRHQASIGLAGW